MTENEIEVNEKKLVGARLLVGWHNYWNLHILQPLHTVFENDERISTFHLGSTSHHTK